MRSRYYAKKENFTSSFFMIASQCKRVDSNHQSNDAIARSTIWPISCYAYRHRPLKFDYRPATSHFWWIQNFRLRAMLMDGIEPSQTGNDPECSMPTSAWWLPIQSVIPTTSALWTTVPNNQIYTSLIAFLPGTCSHL